MKETPSFSGWNALVLHRIDDGIERLARQLARLGLNTSVQWEGVDAGEVRPDIVLVDADRGWNGLLPWGPGEAPVPLVALLGSEAPGRIAWALEHGAGAVIAKPIATSSIYPALVMATRMHARQRETLGRLAELEERLRLRPLVYGAIQAIMSVRRLDEDAAYRVLRSCAMHRRLTIEQVAAEIAAGRLAVPEAG